jgi:acetylornithine/N-succinyldiaminopimelate aminotransferase
MTTWQTRFDQRVMRSIGMPLAKLERGEGARVWDDEGREYLDFLAGIAVNSLGHAHPVFVEAVSRQAARLAHVSNYFATEPALELAERLTRLAGAAEGGRAWFGNSGAEANEAAFKLARLNNSGGARTRVIGLVDAFHGRTMGSLALTGKPHMRQAFEPLPGGVEHIPATIEAIEAAVDDAVAAVILEPIQGEAGVVVPPIGYLAELRALCDRAGVLLIVDEVQTGVGRSGTLFSYQQAGIAPDIMTLGKGLGGGVPLAALLAREAVCCFEHGDQGGTYNGNPLMTAVGLAVLETVAEPAFLEGVRTRGARLAAGLERLKARHGAREVRGSGLLLALDLGRDIAAEVVRGCRDHGLLLNGPRPNLLRLMPALNVSDEDIDRMLAILDEVLAGLTTG